MTLANKLTPETVKEYHNDLTSFVDAWLITAYDVNEAITNSGTIEDLIKFGGFTSRLFEVLEEFEIPDPMEFLKLTAVTVPVIHEVFIYTPWEPGDTSIFSLATQIEIISHEATHAYRQHRDSDWLENYLLKFAVRCKEERYAFQTSLELCYLLHGAVPQLQHLVGSMDKYFLRPTDEEVLIAGLAQIMLPIEQGDRSTPIGKWAAEWFAKKDLI